MAGVTGGAIHRGAGDALTALHIASFQAITNVPVVAVGVTGTPAASPRDGVQGQLGVENIANVGTAGQAAAVDHDVELIGARETVVA